MPKDDSLTRQSASQIDIQIDPVLGPEAPQIIDAARLAEAVQAALADRGVDRGTVNVVLMDDAAVREMNRAYRGVDSPTDVLSFAAQEEGDDDLLSDPDLPPELRAELADHWGDLVIAFPYAQRQAARYATPIQAELRLLCVHGTLHLLGYDHATPEEEAEMWAIQDAILAGLGDRGVGSRDWGAGSVD